MPVAVLARAIGLLLALPPGDYELVRARYFGETCPEIAERLGLGKDAVLYRLRKIIRANPTLRHLVPVRARFGRKPKSVSL